MSQLRDNEDLTLVVRFVQILFQGFPSRAQLRTGALGVTVAFAPLAFGGAVPWASRVLLAGAVVAFALSAPDVQWRRSGPIGWALLALCALTALQLVPLPAWLVGLMSPEARAMRRLVLGEVAAGDWQRLSLDPVGTYEGLVRLCAVTLTFLAATTLGRRDGVPVVILVSVVVGVLIATYGMIETFSENEHVWFTEKVVSRGAVTGTYINRNHFAGLMALLVPMALGLGLSRQVPRLGRMKFLARFVYLLSDPAAWQRLLLHAFAGVLTLAAILSLSRGGMLALFVGFAAVCTLAAIEGRDRRMALVGAIIVVSTATFWVSGYELEQVMTRFVAVDVETAPRPVLWRGTLGIIADYPLVGSGAGTFVNVFPRYQPRPLLGQAVYAHADLLQVPAEMGLPAALFLFGAIVFVTVRTMWRLMTGTRYTTHQRLLGFGIIGAVIAAACRITVDFDYQIAGNAVVMGAILGMLVAITRHRDDAVSRRLWGVLPVMLLLVVVLAPDSGPSRRLAREYAGMAKFGDEVDARAKAAAEALHGENPPADLVRALRVAILNEEHRRGADVVEASLDDLAVAIRQAPTTPWYHAARAVMLGRIGDRRLRDETRHHAKVAVALFPKDGQTRLDAAEAVLRYDPNDAEAHQWLADALALNPRLWPRVAERAVAAGAGPALQARLRSDDLSSHRVLVRAALFEGRRVDHAKRMLEQLMALEPPRAIAPEGPRAVVLEARTVNRPTDTLVCIVVDGKHAGHVAVGPEWSEVVVLVPRETRSVVLRIASLNHGMGAPRTALEVREVGAKKDGR